jgi:type II secretory pathway component PulK
MEENKDRTFWNILKEQKGFMLPMILMVLVCMLILGLAYAMWARTSLKATHIQRVESKNYYYAETGINDAILKLSTDPEFREKFIDGKKDIEKYTIEMDQRELDKDTIEKTIVEIIIEDE